MTKKNILIIGSQGYLGSQLIIKLNKLGYNCFRYDLGYFKKGVLGYINHNLDSYKDVKDINENDIKDYDVIIQLAAFSNDPIDNLDPNLFYNPTKEYTIAIAKLCKKLQKKFIFPSSCSVYGISKDILDETSPTNPQTHYSQNKLDIENELIKMTNNKFVPIILRLATVYGYSPRVRFDVVINMLIGMALTTKEIILNSNGQSWRPHVHIDDVCNIIVRCIENNHFDINSFPLNVGSNESNAKVLDLAIMIQKAIKDCKVDFLTNYKSDTVNNLIKDRKINNGVDKRTYRINFNKINNILPKLNFLNLEKGINETIYLFKKHNLDQKLFKQKDFYRLQKLEEIYQKNKLNIK